MHFVLPTVRSRAPHSHARVDHTYTIAVTLSLHSWSTEFIVKKILYMLARLKLSVVFIISDDAEVVNSIKDKLQQAGCAKGIRVASDSYFDPEQTVCSR